jgi:hypothetical protein
LGGASVHTTHYSRLEKGGGAIRTIALDVEQLAALSIAWRGQLGLA